MQYISGTNRSQITLMPNCLDDYVSEDNVVRVIDVFVDRLDMGELGFAKAKLKACGRPPYDPAMLLKLYIYGYMNRTRSSRRLEALARVNIEVMWLLGKVVPDDRCIADFRKENGEAIKKAFREFSLMCGRLGLYGGKDTSVDGTKIRANANRRSVHTQKGTEAMIAKVNEKIERYMKMLNETDAEEADEPQISQSTVKSILKHLGKKKEKLQALQKQIEDNNGETVSTVDPDARIMKTNGDGRALDACYNVQTIADNKHGIVMGFEVTKDSGDSGNLFAMTECAKEILGVEEIDVSADKAYYDSEDIAKCEQNRTVTYIPPVKVSEHAPDRKYAREYFVYDAENDRYTCPEGQQLLYNPAKQAKESRLYENPKACKSCPYREKCTTASKRRIYRLKNQEALERNNARMKTETGKKKYRERSKTIEHIFGTIKAVWGYRQFLCRTQERTSTEQALAFLAYNLRRASNIFAQNRRNLVKEIAM
jgi:transposase